MHAVGGGSTKWPNVAKRFPENLLRKHTFQNWKRRHVDIGWWRRIGRNAVGPLEVVVIVTAASAKRESHRECRAPATCAANALLIVEPQWRHVRHHYGEKRANIDARFHRRSHA